MSGVAVLRYLLANDAAVLEEVPAERILPGTLPLNIAPPAIALHQISGSELLGVRVNEGPRTRTDRVRVSVYTSSYLEQKTLLALVLAACPSQRGAVNGISVDSITPAGEGPDIYDADLALFEQSRDFFVRWVGP